MDPPDKPGDDKCTVLFTIILLLTACTSHTKAPVYNGWKSWSGRRSQYIVQKGDTLYSIAFAFNQDYRDIARANHLRAPYGLKRGMHLVMWAQEQEQPSLEKPRLNRVGPKARLEPPLNQSVGNKTHKTTHRVTKPKPRKHKTIPLHIRWHRPTQGRIVERYSLKPGGNKGIDIQGKLNQPIRAAAPGKVVYAGHGLRGYGNLLIIKHNDSYLSAYAYNRKLLVQEGANVKKGQKVATMGQHDHHTRLHFEIRLNGKPVDPLRYV